MCRGLKIGGGLFFLFFLSRFAAGGKEERGLGDGGRGLSSH